MPKFVRSLHFDIMKAFRQPLLIITAIWITGVICAIAISENPVSGIIILSSIIALICFLPLKSITPVIRILSLCLLAASIIRTNAYRYVAPDDISMFAEGKKACIYGKIVSDPLLTSDKTGFTIRADRVKTYSGIYNCSGYASASVYKSRYNDKSETISVLPSYGDTVEIHGRLSHPRKPTNPGQVDYPKYLSRRHIYCTISADQSGYKNINARSYGIRKIVYSFKKKLVDTTERMFEKNQRSLLIGILLGNYSDLPYDIKSDFMRTGTMHLLAASGYNCGILILIFGFMFRFLTVPRNIAHISLIIIIWIFVLLAGSGPSITRAAIMVTLVLMAYLLKRTTNFFNIVLFTIFTLLISNPLNLYDIGFQLSFAAVLSIVIIMPLLTNLIQSTGSNDGTIKNLFIRLTVSIYSVLFVSLAAILGTWPITSYYFNYFSLSAIICNALVAALVFPITVFGIASLVIGSISAIFGAGFAYVTNLFLNSMLWIVEKSADLKWSSISVHSPHPAIIMVYYILLVSFIEYLNRRNEGKADNAANE